MKKWMTLTLTLFSLLALPACGGQAEPKNVDLTEVYASMEEVCDWWTGGYMEDVPEEALELYYPGLSGLHADVLRGQRGGAGGMQVRGGRGQGPGDSPGPY